MADRRNSRVGVGVDVGVPPSVRAYEYAGLGGNEGFVHELKHQKTGGLTLTSSSREKLREYSSSRWLEYKVYARLGLVHITHLYAVLKLDEQSRLRGCPVH